ncbi:hypothetical protein FRX31_005536 [Thalictrum thalictroides]|uniref:Uncharacterized protein n=1 Tax=Thalictrum thalictroides TaxID=46969 RepID=A0A7J6X664_THATH|nr:hypothetical protein FRX31_005536 [Thalictrum thalictroides]
MPPDRDVIKKNCDGTGVGNPGLHDVGIIYRSKENLIKSKEKEKDFLQRLKALKVVYKKATSNVVVSKNTPPLGKGKKCSLAVDMISNIVAKGKVSSRKPMGKDRTYNKERIKQKDFSRKLVEGKKIPNKEQLNQENIRNLDCNAQRSFDSFEETLHLMYPNETDHIKFPIGKDVFAGEYMEFGYIPKRNILDVCQMKDLYSDILIVYMR